MSFNTGGGMDLYDELVSILDAFNNNGIDYALCGGIAVALHGYPRFTKDIDFLIREDDLKTIQAAIEPLGYVFSSGILPFGVGTPNERHIFRISKIEGTEVLTLDLMLVSSIFEDVWNSREVFDWQERALKAVSREGLAKMKRLAGRDQDLLDLKKLGLMEEKTEDE